MASLDLRTVSNAGLSSWRTPPLPLGLGLALDLLMLSPFFLSFFSLFFNKRGNSDLSKLNKQSNTPLGISKEAPALKVYYENLKMLLEGFPRGLDSKENARGLGLSAGVKSRPAPDGSNLHSI